MGFVPFILAGNQFLLFSQVLNMFGIGGCQGLWSLPNRSIRAHFRSHPQTPLKACHPPCPQGDPLPPLSFLGSHTPGCFVGVRGVQGHWPGFLSGSGISPSSVLALSAGLRQPYHTHTHTHAWPAQTVLRLLLHVYPVSLPHQHGAPSPGEPQPRGPKQLPRNQPLAPTPGYALSPPPVRRRPLQWDLQASSYLPRQCSHPL